MLRVPSPPLRGYTRLNSFRLCRRMVSLTATKTKRMFSVSVAQVKWGYSVLSLSGFCSWYIFRMNSWAAFGSCWGPAQGNHQNHVWVPSHQCWPHFGNHEGEIYFKYFVPWLLALIVGLQHNATCWQGASAAQRYWVTSLTSFQLYNCQSVSIQSLLTEVYYLHSIRVLKYRQLSGYYFYFSTLHLGDFSVL